MIKTHQSWKPSQTPCQICTSPTQNDNSGAVLVGGGEGQWCTKNYLPVPKSLGMPLDWYQIHVKYEVVIIMIFIIGT